MDSVIHSSNTCALVEEMHVALAVKVKRFAQKHSNVTAARSRTHPAALRLTSPVHN